MAMDRDGDLPIGASWRLLFSREDGFRRDPKDGEPPAAERLRELLKKEATLTQKQAAEMLGVSDRTVRRHWPKSSEDEQATLLEDEGEE